MIHLRNSFFWPFLCGISNRSTDCNEYFAGFFVALIQRNRASTSFFRNALFHFYSGMTVSAFIRITAAFFRALSPTNPDQNVTSSEMKATHTHTQHIERRLSIDCKWHVE